VEKKLTALVFLSFFLSSFLHIHEITFCFYCKYALKISRKNCISFFYFGVIILWLSWIYGLRICAQIKVLNGKIDDCRFEPVVGRCFFGLEIWVGSEDCHYKAFEILGHF
jgi:hypothetical protein